MRFFLRWWCLVAVLVAGLLGCGQSTASSSDTGSIEQASDPPASVAAAPVEQPTPPPVDALPVVDLEATRALVEVSAEAGQVTVIDFWATWCAPCVEIFDDLHDQLHDLGEQVRPVSVTFDAAGEYESKAIAFLHRHDALKDAYRVDGDGAKQEQLMQLGDRWTNLAVPVILVFDQQGQLSAEFHAEEAVVADIVDHVKTLLN